MRNRFCCSFLAVTGGLALVLFAGCGQINSALRVGTALAGNWTFAPSSSSVVLNLGFTQGAYETVSAIARLQGTSCVTPQTDILLTGSVDANNNVTLVSSAFGGTTLTIQGQLAANGKGMAAAQWAFAGGNCASLGKANVTATNYSTIGGTYLGTFTDRDANPIGVSAFLQQTTQPDENGQFSVSGTATFPSSPCFTQQPTVTSSLVTGSSLSMTYTDPGSGAVLTATGSFNSAATQLTIASWSIVGGSCNGDSGTGTMTLE
ncbi:MAG TPA: hypothetical protein VHX13_11625 [Acidobacteriaceae bacterium]|jgi:hypothetical protein|nr:hypothetical protein [Acidobacteriaceae bacterium]